MFKIYLISSKLMTIIIIGDHDDHYDDDDERTIHNPSKTVAQRPYKCTFICMSYSNCGDAFKQEGSMKN